MTKAYATLCALMLFCALVPGLAYADALAGAGDRTEAEAHDTEMREDFEVKFQINRALREAAEKLVAESADADALKYLKMSGAAAAEGERHYRSADYAFALEDIAESTRLANYAIVLASDENASTRDAVMKETQRLVGELEHERKEARIRRGISEAEVFIQTAGRLLREGEHPEARKDMNEATGLLKESKAALAAERYDVAIEDLDKAYRLATRSVRTIKGARNEPITFPKPRDGDVDEVLAYELKRNDTYLSLTEQYKGAQGSKAPASVKRAMRLRTEAEGAIRAGNKQKAIENLRGSTGAIVEALNAPVE